MEQHAIEGCGVTQGCGLVVEQHAIDERSEWRTFADKAGTRCLEADLDPYVCHYSCVIAKLPSVFSRS